MSTSAGELGGGGVGKGGGDGRGGRHDDAGDAAGRPPRPPFPVEFGLVVDGISDFAIFLTDTDGRVTLWNAAAEKMMGWSEAEMVGRPAALTFTPEDRAAGEPEKEMANARRDGRAADVRWHLRKDGSRFWANGVLTALRDRRDGDEAAGAPAVGGGAGGGPIRGFVKVMRDETDRRLFEESLRAAKELAESASAAKDQFLATLSHELRTPISAILLWAKMLRRREGIPPDVIEAIDAITNSAEAQKQLIDDLLDTSRIAAGKLRVDLRPVDLGPLVQSSVETAQPTADAKGVKLLAEIGQEVGPVRADPDRLRQVLWNLLANAVKFTPAGGQVRVTLSSHADGAGPGRHAEIRVSDTGIGISREFLPHVFEPFRQGDASTTRTYGGLGLGLSICKQLVEHHGGTITAQSDGPGKGATFTVRLPAGAARGGPRAPGAHVPSPAGASGDGALLKGLHVLLVEDEPSTRNALVVLMQEAGLKVTAVDTVARAADAFEKTPPDLIVSDVALPDGSGLELISRLRKIESSGKKKTTKRTPALALTAFARAEDRDRALAAGFDRHLGKPVDPEQLLDGLRSLATGIKK